MRKVWSGGCGQTPLKVVPSTCSPIHSSREMVVVEEQQMIQSTGGKKVRGEGGRRELFGQIF